MADVRRGPDHTSLLDVPAELELPLDRSAATRYDGAMVRTRLESKPIKLRKVMPVTTQALADVRGGRSTLEPVAAFITYGGYDTTDG